jgi:hypothetical protein
VIIPIFVGTIYPIIAYILPKYLFTQNSKLDNYKISNISSVLTVLAPVSVELSVNPIPQTQAALFALMSIICLALYFSKDNVRYVILALLFLSLIAWTHKITPYIISIGFGFSIVFLYLSANRRRGRLVVVFLVMICWLYLQVQITPISNALVGVIFGNTGISTLRIEDPQSAELILPYAQKILLTIGYQGVVLLFAGLGWILFTYKSLKKPGSTPIAGLFLSLTATGTGLGIGWYLGIVPTPSSRFFLMIVPYLSILVSYIFISISSSAGELLQLDGLIVTLVLVFCILTSQSVSLTASSDSNFEPRKYLIEKELAAQHWEYSYINETIVTDGQYATHISPSLIPVLAERYSSYPSRYTTNTDAILNGELNTLSDCYFSVRPNIRRYGQWKLSDPISEQLSMQDKLYSTGSKGTEVYYNSHCV